MYNIFKNWVYACIAFIHSWTVSQPKETVNLNGRNVAFATRWRLGLHGFGEYLSSPIVRLSSYEYESKHCVALSKMVGLGGRLYMGDYNHLIGRVKGLKSDMPKDKVVFVDKFYRDAVRKEHQAFIDELSDPYGLLVKLISGIHINNAELFNIFYQTKDLNIHPYLCLVAKNLKVTKTEATKRVLLAMLMDDNLYASGHHILRRFINPDTES